MPTIRIGEEIRNKLRKYKDDRGMTYDGAILELLQNESADVEIPSERESEQISVWTQQRWYREGAHGASEYVLAILRSQLTEADRYGPTVRSAVWDTYNKWDVEPELSARSSDEKPPSLGDLLEVLAETIENPADFTVAGTDYEIKIITEEATDILRSLSTHQKAMGGNRIPLESEERPRLEVPEDRTYRGEQREGVNLVTADGDDLDLRPDLTGVNSVSWGYAGRGPRSLAKAILADDYTDRYANARSKDLYNYFSRLSTGESWEITAGELDEYLSQP